MGFAYYLTVPTYSVSFCDVKAIEKSVNVCWNGRARERSHGRFGIMSSRLLVVGVESFVLVQGSTAQALPEVSRKHQQIIYTKNACYRFFAK